MKAEQLVYIIIIVIIVIIVVILIISFAVAAGFQMHTSDTMFDLWTETSSDKTQQEVNKQKNIFTRFMTEWGKESDGRVARVSLAGSLWFLLS